METRAFIADLVSCLQNSNHKIPVSIILQKPSLYGIPNTFYKCVKKDLALDLHKSLFNQNQLTVSMERSLELPSTCQFRIEIQTLFQDIQMTRETGKTRPNTWPNPLRAVVCRAAGHSHLLGRTWTRRPPAGPPTAHFHPMPS